MLQLSRRTLLGGAVSLGVAMATEDASLGAETRLIYDFTLPLVGWESVSGRWQIERMGDAANGVALVQRATRNPFNVLVAPAGAFTNVDISTRFKPISGREDASGGIVFRFDKGRYYVVRANALEDNFNFYFYEQGRRQIAGASVKAPALGQWHTLRVTADGDRIRGWLNDQPLLEQKDSRFASGQVGLWTKADSVTAFESLIIAPIGRS